MKKSLFLASLMLIGTTNAMAAKVGDTSVGIAFGGMHTNATTTATNLTTGVSTSAEGSDNTTYEALRVAKYYDFGRIGIELGHGNKKDGVTTNYFGVEYAYMFYNESKFTPFLGGQVGYSKSEAKASPFTVDETGFTYGVSIGALYAITKVIDLEIGARYLGTNISGDDTQTITGTPIKVNVDLDNITQYYFGINYNF